MLAETVTIRGYEGDVIPAYFARPLGAGPYPGVVVIHHMPGWDEWSKEVTRTFARQGYTALCPHLHHRDAPGASSDDAAKAAREAGGAPDARVVGDVAAAVAVLRALPEQQRQSRRDRPLLRRSPRVAGRVPGRHRRRHRLLRRRCRHARRPAQRSDAGRADRPHRPTMRCPLLGLFGKEDQHPSPEQVVQQAEALRNAGKEFEFHSYDDAGHAFFCTTRPDVPRRGRARRVATRLGLLRPPSRRD